MCGFIFCIGTCEFIIRLWNLIVLGLCSITCHLYENEFARCASSNMCVQDEFVDRHSLRVFEDIGGLRGYKSLALTSSGQLTMFNSY